MLREARSICSCCPQARRVLDAIAIERGRAALLTQVSRVVVVMIHDTEER